MNWLLRALLGPTLWAVAFSGIYALHGLGCARGWPAIATSFGSLHHLLLVSLWGICVGLALIILLRTPMGTGRAAEIARIGGWIGVGATILTLLPILAVSTCGPETAFAALFVKTASATI
ncbi:hypothetical protein [Niveispirillum sp. KHB5.9]|uniref:hypothetical protein n=1 Tax=Niveispirillum sp. KHB5.9 TaxID=3400269 RepID=UPI003A855630